MPACDCNPKTRSVFHQKLFFISNSLRGWPWYIIVSKLQADQYIVIESWHLNILAPSIRWAYLILIIVISKHKPGNIHVISIWPFCRYPGQLYAQLCRRLQLLNTDTHFLAFSDVDGITIRWDVCWSFPRMVVTQMRTLVDLNPLDLLYCIFNIRTPSLIDRPKMSLTEAKSLIKTHSQLPYTWLDGSRSRISYISAYGRLAIKTASRKIVFA